jgi:hypothetical protein
MKQIIIISDPGGFPLRQVAPATIAETVVICPSDKSHAHAQSVEFPEDWLPDFDPAMEYGRRCWWVCDRIFPAAVAQLNLDADYYWCVESDVVAKPGVWRNLIEASSGSERDGIYVHLSNRPETERPDWFGHPTTPPWALQHALGAMFRLSRRAMGWLAESAPVNRNVFCEINNPSIVRHAGGTLADLGTFGWFYNDQCMKGHGHQLGINTGLFCHPVKTNTEEPLKTW